MHFLKIGGEADERTQVEILEDKLKEFIDLTTQKSSQGRVNSFDALCKAFSAKYMPDFVAGRRMTLLDCAERGMKKGRGAEQESAAKLMALLCLQLGSVADSESIYRDHKTYLLSLMADNSASPSARAQVFVCLFVFFFFLNYYSYPFFLGLFYFKPMHLPG